MSKFDLASTARLKLPNSRLMTLKSQLKLYLQESGMTAAQLSRKSGVSKQTLSLWLSGTQPKNIGQVKKVADVLGTDINNLCFGSSMEKKTVEANEMQSFMQGGWLSGTFELKLRKVK